MWQNIGWHNRTARVAGVSAMTVLALYMYTRLHGRGMMGSDKVSVATCVLYIWSESGKLHLTTVALRTLPSSHVLIYCRTLPLRCPSFHIRTYSTMTPRPSASPTHVYPVIIFGRLPESTVTSPFAPFSHSQTLNSWDIAVFNVFNSKTNFRVSEVTCNFT